MEPDSPFDPQVTARHVGLYAAPAEAPAGEAPEWPAFPAAPDAPVPESGADSAAQGWAPPEAAPKAWTLPPLDPTLPLTPDGLVLRVVAGPGALRAAGAAVMVTRAGCPLGVTLGRELDNTVPLPDRKISRHHARIESSAGVWLVVDLQSTNGTRLNGVPIHRAGLSTGDFLYLGDTVLRVEPVRRPAR